MKERKVQAKWHDEDLNITLYGLSAMRTLIVVSSLLGFALGLSIVFFIRLL